MAKELNESVKEVKAVDDEETTGVETTNQPYDARLITIENTSFPIFQIMSKIQREEINLQPDFQRHFVWDNIRKSRLIESILIKIPLPSFYIDAINDDEWLIVDGLQRLNTLNEFINKKELVLTSLEFLDKEVAGLTFDKLPRLLQRRLEETHLSFFVIRPETPTEAKLTIFRRLNTGGLVLTSQEIRHCLFQGKSTTLLKELAKSDEFLAATGGSIPTLRMVDEECVLRFCAFHLTKYQSYTKPDLDVFLGDAMKLINKMCDMEIQSLMTAFIDSMLKAREVFGDYAFRKMYEKNGRRNPINKALFETWSVSLNGFDIELLRKHKEKINVFFIELINSDRYFDTSITQGTGDVKKVHYRFTFVESIIKKAIIQ
ncbi:MAG: DUF262 domain-containing protein [Candidatus Magnetominusculus sp. LBB02]|nr:DUF262 domain-containing protein [Candidatus Magnetominusculus sp. LBB02]